MSNGEIMRLDNFQPSTPLDIITGDGGVSLSVAAAKQWLCPQAPDHEVLRLLLTCKKEGLDPFRREAELVCYGGKWEVVVGKAGHLAKAAKHPAYDGFRAGIIVQPRDVTAKPPVPAGPPIEVEGTYYPGIGEANATALLVGGWCEVYRKDRRLPFRVTVSAREFNKGQSTWQSMPCTMIRKTAIVQAFRESGLCGSGFYDAAELGGGSTRAPEVAPAAIPASIEREYDTHEPDAGICPPDMLTKILAILGALGVDRNGYQWRKALADRGVSRECDLDEQAARELLTKLSVFEPNPELEPEAAAHWAAHVPARPDTAPPIAAEAAPVVTLAE